MRDMPREWMRMPEGRFFFFPFFPIIPVIALVVFLIIRSVNKKKRINSVKNNSRLSQQETELFFKATPRKYWKKMEIFFYEDEDKVTITRTEKLDPVEDLINQFAHGEITIEEYEERVKKVV